jgi:hypothetical protein
MSGPGEKEQACRAETHAQVYLWSFYAADPRARINLGIRRRLAPLLENDRRKIELLNWLLFSQVIVECTAPAGSQVGSGFFSGDKSANALRSRLA